MRQGVGVQADTLRGALAGALARFEPADACTGQFSEKDFQCVSTLGYFTPRARIGAGSRRRKRAPRTPAATLRRTSSSFSLGGNKSQALIFACNGAECWKSFKASRAAIQAGYTRVSWFRAGFPAWRGSGRKVATGSAEAAKAG